MDPIEALAAQKIAVLRRIEALTARPVWTPDDYRAVLRDLGDFARLAGAEGKARALLDDRN
jgi:hypothetical protein